MASTLIVDKIQKTGGVAFILPAADGSAGQLLKTDGSLGLGWATDVDTGITSVAADSSPQLGGDLDCNGNDITSASNADVDINPHGTGDVVLKTDLVKIGGGSEAGVITSNGAYDLTLETNSGTNSGTIAITDGANGNIAVTPNGTGNVQLSADEVTIGDSGATSTLTSNGTGNLLLSTNSGTNSSTIEITDAANGAITLACNGTGVIDLQSTMNPSISSTGKALVLGF